jgi:hypothetical protein
VANINGNNAYCCVMLMKLPQKTLAHFCAAPFQSKGFAQMPPNAVVELKPSCHNSLGAKGSLACTVTFNQLPAGYTFPAGYSQAKPLSVWSGNTFQPCASGKFKRMIQVVSKTSPVKLTAKCE